MWSQERAVLGGVLDSWEGKQGRIPDMVRKEEILEGPARHERLSKAYRISRGTLTGTAHICHQGGSRTNSPPPPPPPTACLPPPLPQSRGLSVPRWFCLASLAISGQGQVSGRFWVL